MSAKIHSVDLYNILKDEIMKKVSVDMTEGPIFGKIVAFTVPVVLAGVLQLLYNAADMVVVGRFAPEGSLGAVSATVPLINLIINVLIGLSVGTCVIVARYYGERNERGISRAAHTSISLSLIGGILVGVIGILLAGPLLNLMKTPPEVLGRSVAYMRIYFCGMPFNALFNYGSAIMRAGGDTKRPMYYLASAGVANVLLNLLFVIQFEMGVAGVALATIISQAISAFLVFFRLCRSSGPDRIDPRELRVHKGEFLHIMRVGLPAGIQGSVFSISNVLIQSSINSFGPVVMDGNAAASNLDSFVYTAMNGVSQATLAFVSQNYGAAKFKRIFRVVWQTVAITAVLGLCMGIIFNLLGDKLLWLYNDDPTVIGYGQVRLLYVCLPYLLCGIMDVFSGAMRGIGKSSTAMVISLLGACAFRIVWIYTVFRQFGTLESLYISYPVSWALTSLTFFVFFTVSLKKQKHRAMAIMSHME